MASLSLASSKSEPGAYGLHKPLGGREGEGGHHGRVQRVPPWQPADAAQHPVEAGEGKLRGQGKGRDGGGAEREHGGPAQCPHPTLHAKHGSKSRGSAGCAQGTSVQVANCPPLHTACRTHHWHPKPSC